MSKSAQVIISALVCDQPIVVVHYNVINVVHYKMGQQFDQKNIRRRVYDALNVLMAMNIISKEKKEIRWIGLPTNTAQECQGLEVSAQLSMA